MQIVETSTSLLVDDPTRNKQHADTIFITTVPDDEPPALVRNATMTSISGFYDSHISDYYPPKVPQHDFIMMHVDPPPDCPFPLKDRLDDPDTKPKPSNQEQACCEDDLDLDLNQESQPAREPSGNEDWMMMIKDVQKPGVEEDHHPSSFSMIRRMRTSLCPSQQTQPRARRMPSPPPLCRFHKKVGPARVGPALPFLEGPKPQHIQHSLEQARANFAKSRFATNNHLTRSSSASPLDGEYHHDYSL